MMPWNRKELWMGDSMQTFSQIRDLLHASGIPYDSAAKSAAWSGGRGFDARASGGIAMRYGQSAENDSLYYVYVHKYEYEKAAHLLGRMLKGAR